MTKHIMNLVETYPSGAEKWDCVCDRQSCSKGGLQISGLEISDPMSDDLRSQVDEILENL